MFANMFGASSELDGVMEFGYNAINEFRDTLQYTGVQTFPP